MKKNTSFITDKKLHVFFGDDDQEDIEFFKRAISETSDDIRITIAKDGLQLLEFLQVVVPDIIFLDLNMPRMNGIDCLKEIRNQEIYKDVPVIIYSTTAEKAHIDLTYALGANMYIQKPENFTKIKDRLAKTLALSLDDLVPQPPKSKYVVNLARAVV
jgi:CheY-like chemotaxis protein